MMAVLRPTAAKASGSEGLRFVDLTVSADGQRITLARLHELDPRLDRLEGEIRGGAVDALVLRLGSTAESDADLDLDEVRGLPDMEARRVWSGEGQRVLRRIEMLPIPTVAVLMGGCFSGSLQVALACGYRIAADSSLTRIGFPEAKLGVIPGWGGSVRLPRLLGIRVALDVLLAAEPLSAQDARAHSLVDEVCAPAELEARAVACALRFVSRPRLNGLARRRIAARITEETAPGRRLLYARARSRIDPHGELHTGVAEILIRGIADGIGRSLEQSFQSESAGFAAALSSKTVRGLLHSRLLVEQVSAGVPRSRRAAPEAALAFAEAAVLGGSARCAMYADLLVTSGCAVKLKDVSSQSALRGVSLVRARLSWAAEQKQIAAHDIDARIERLSTATGYGGFGRLDAVIEAVEEDADTKRSVLREVEEHVRDDCLLVVTSPIVPLREVATALRDPSRLVGLHFLPLSGGLAPAEVVRSPWTSEVSIDRACELARQLGRLPVVVNDTVGLLLLRMTVRYVAAAEALLESGVPAPLVDAAMREFGMPFGPIELAELLGRGSLARAADSLTATFGERFRLREPFLTGGAGAASTSTLHALLRVPNWLRRRSRAERESGDTRTALPARTPPHLQLHILLAMVDEAARILDDGVIASAGALDMTVSLGLGFPLDHGGVLYWADTAGTAMVRDLITRSRAEGDDLDLSALLVSLTEANRGFYQFTGTSASVAGQSAAGMVT